jgi:mono/diheme cytochrome c family protein
MAKRPSNGKFLGQIPLHCVMRSLAAVIVMLVFASPTLAADSPGLDRLMGGEGRVNHEEKIEKLVFKGGKRYSWKDFSNWGKELFINGQVKKPPTGPRPSKPISKSFKCMSCHNYEREDPVLTNQNAEARFEWIEKTGREIYLLQGATMWGVVNRETFYPDYYAIYHHLCVPKGKKPPSTPCGPLLKVCGPGCRTMDPDNLEDAIQVCSAYCSAGRYLEEWELYALLAFFWDQEIRLKDLDLSPEQAAHMKAVLTSLSPDPQYAKGLRGLLAGKYAKKADNTFRGDFKSTRYTRQGSIVVEYEDGTKYTGESGRGERLWTLSCARCHGTKNLPEKATHFTRDLGKFHKMLAKGTRHRDKHYMPNFTLERLSRQQAADILLYLRQIAR